MCSVLNLWSPFSAWGNVQRCRSMYGNLSELTESAFLRKTDSSFPSLCQLWILPQLTLRLCEFLSLECRQLWSYAQSQSWVHESNGPVMSRSHGFTAVTSNSCSYNPPYLLLQWSPSLGEERDMNVSLRADNLSSLTLQPRPVVGFYIIYYLCLSFILKINLFLQYFWL